MPRENCPWSAVWFKVTHQCNSSCSSSWSSCTYLLSSCLRSKPKPLHLAAKAPTYVHALIVVLLVLHVPPSEIPSPRALVASTYPPSQGGLPGHSFHKCSPALPALLPASLFPWLYLPSSCLCFFYPTHFLLGCVCILRAGSGFGLLPALGVPRQVPGMQQEFTKPRMTCSLGMSQALGL